MNNMGRTPLAFILLLVLTAPSNGGASVPTPPTQPPSGPGGYPYPHKEVTTNGPYYPTWHPNDEHYQYYIFEPANPRPDMAPVVLFIHGYQALLPTAYTEWIGHIVRKGYTVVWVKYDTGITVPWAFSMYVEAAWKDALHRLDTYWWEDHVLPEKDSRWYIKTAVVGHSAGGYLGPILAAHAADPGSEIPAPYAVVSIEPGGLGVIPKADFSLIEPATKMVILVSDEDDIVCKSTGQAIWKATSQLPDENKDFLFYRSDRHGRPEQIANHFFPNTSGYGDTAAVDARDYYITFKLSAALLDCAFKGAECEYALGNGAAEQVFMGGWSDGRPIRPLEWIPDPSGLETTCVDKFHDIPRWGAGEAQAAALYGTAEARMSASLNWACPIMGLLVLFRVHRKLRK